MQRRDASAKFLWVDEHTTSVLGWTWEELREMTALDLVHPDDLERAVDSWMVMGETEPVRLRYRDPSDTYRWFEVHNTYHLEDPDQAFVETEMIDIDAEMRALARVRETEMQYAILMEALPVGVVQVDMGGEIVFAN
ncbi:MAG: PAS domain-containing protein, partial [Actinomycetota bacterium]|nr:PAS domain-containing protein [Actinomycetota bacterium]